MCEALILFVLWIQAGVATGKSTTSNRKCGVTANLSATTTSTFNITGNALTITNNTVLGNAAKVKVLTTLTRTVAGEKIKTKQPAHLVIVDADSNGGPVYGTASQHKEIS